MRSPVPKPLVPVAGVPMLHRLLRALGAAGIGRIAVVVGHGASAVRASLDPTIAAAEQRVRDGTASAVEAGRSAAGDAGHVLVFVGDSPLVRPETIRALLDRHRGTGAACTFLLARFPRPFPYARVLRDPDGRVTGCVEERDATPAERSIDEYLTSHYAFRAAALWAHLPAVPRHPRTGERYLTDVLALLAGAGEEIDALVVDDWRELVGLNTPEDVAWAEGVLVGR